MSLCRQRPWVAAGGNPEVSRLRLASPQRPPGPAASTAMLQCEGTETLIEAPMGDARFFTRSGPHALANIATAAEGTAPAIERMFAGVAPLQSACLNDVNLLDNRRYAEALEQTTAGAVHCTSTNADSGSFGLGEAKAFLTNSGARIDINPGAKQGVPEAGVGADSAVAVHRDAGADEDERPDTTARTDFGSGFNDCVRSNLSSRVYLCIRIHHGRGMNPRVQRRDETARQHAPRLHKSRL
jgi:hypothetical protein